MRSGDEACLDGAFPFSGQSVARVPASGAEVVVSTHGHSRGANEQQR